MHRYCLISKCANLGVHPTFKDGHVSVMCHVVDTIEQLCSYLNRYQYHGKDVTKDIYIQHVIDTVTVTNKVYYFEQLSLNSDCCHLYLYRCEASDPDRIVESEFGEYHYVLMSQEENKELWSL